MDTPTSNTSHTPVEYNRPQAENIITRVSNRLGHLRYNLITYDDGFPLDSETTIKSAIHLLTELQAMMEDN